MEKQPKNSAKRRLSFTERLNEALRIVSDEWMEAEIQYWEMLKISNEREAVAKGKRMA